MMTLQSETFGLLFLSLFLLPVGNATGQPTHGEVVEISEKTLRVALADTLTVPDGAEGQVVQFETVGGEERELNVALLSVARVETPKAGPWIAVCRVERQSEPPQAGDKVRFGEVQPRPGRLAVQAEPEGAVVYVDGAQVGTAPLETQVARGRHEVRLEAKGRETRRQTVTVAAGRRQVVDVTLPAMTGTLRVNTQPEGATVRVEGKEIGTAPVEERLEPGDYEVEIERDGYLSARRTATVEPGQETRVNAALRRTLQVRPARQHGDAVTNVRVQRDSTRLVVTYNLVGEEDEYEVALQLSTDGGQTYQALRGTVEGAVGEEITPGSGKQVLWAALTDYPEGLSGSQYRLRVNAEAMDGGNTLLWVVGSALAAGAGGTVALLLGGGGDGGGGDGGNGGYPTPPAPPN